MIRAFLRNESGTETVEWGVMAGLIIAGVVLAVGAIGTWVATQFTTLQSNLGA